MPLVVYVGGLGESQLSRVEGLGTLVWPDPATLTLGHTGAMRLAPDGISPGPPDGVALRPSGGPGPYVTLPLAQLGLQLGIGWSQALFDWDWRQALYPAGVRLAALIRERVTAGDPVSLVCHSAGGIVARAAWTELGMTDQQTLIRRIVTLGTPHWGSYSVVGYFQGSNQSIDILEYLNGTVGYNSAGYAPAITGYQRLDRLFYRRLGLTWPGLYDLLPVLGAPDAGDDPHRELLYDADNWPAEARPQQSHLDYARDHTGSWLRSAASLPPPTVLICVSGRGYYSDSRITGPEAFRAGGGLGGAAQGDNTVTQASSELEGYQTYRYTVGHENQWPSLVTMGEIAELLTGPAPAPTPGPPVVDTQLQPPAVRPIPGSVLPDYTGGGPDKCLGGICKC